MISIGAVFLLKRISFRNNGFDLLLFIAIALVSYALPDLMGGNGYLSAYIVGIVLGNTEFPERKPLVSFFDAITSLMQIVIFFLLETGDEIVICTRSFQDNNTDSLIRHPLSENSKWAGHRVSEYPKKDGSLLVMIQRGDEKIIPNGNTILKEGDVLVLLKRDVAVV